MCKRILIRFWWFRPTVEHFESAIGLFRVVENTRNERIRLSTLRCGAVCCQRTTDGKVVAIQSASTSRQNPSLYRKSKEIWDLGLSWPGAESDNVFLCYNFVHSYSLRSDTLRTFCMKLVDFNYFPMPQIQDFILFEVFPTFSMIFHQSVGLGGVWGELQLRIESLTGALLYYRLMKNIRKKLEKLQKK